MYCNSDTALILLQYKVHKLNQKPTANICGASDKLDISWIQSPQTRAACLSCPNKIGSQLILTCVPKRLDDYIQSWLNNNICCALDTLWFPSNTKSTNFWRTSLMDATMWPLACVSRVAPSKSSAASKLLSGAMIVSPMPAWTYVCMYIMPV